MEEFKEGDLIEMNSNCSGCKIGCQYTLHKGNKSGENKDKLYAWNDNTISLGDGACSCEHKWIKVKTKPMKFNIGDTVKIVKMIAYNGEIMKSYNFMYANDFINKTGKIISIGEYESADHQKNFPYKVKIEGLKTLNYKDEELELITNKMTKINWNYDRFIINCRTKKEWENVVKVAEDNGWTYFKKRNPNNTELWNRYKEDSCISIKGIDAGGYCYTEYYNSSDYCGFMHISATEFINEYNINNNNNQIPDEKPNKQGLKTMLRKLSTMLELQLDKESKALYKAGFINGDLELTQEGKEVNEAINFSKNKTELVKAAEEKIKEEEKSK